MHKILNIIFIIFCITFACNSLRLHNRQYLHNYAQSPEALTNLSRAEQTISAKLSVIQLQIAAVNNTLARNLYMPTVENNAIKMQKISATDLQNQNKLCIILNESTSTDIELYIASIQKKLQQVTTDISGLGATSPHVQDLTYLKQKYSKQNQYIKYLLQNPCQYRLSMPAAVSASPYDSLTMTQLIRIRANSWYLDQNIRNYILPSPTSELQANTCPKQRPYLISGTCQNCQGTTPYYNTSSKSCTNCPMGTYFSQISHSCKNVLVSDPNHCSGGRYENTDGLCVCRSELPFWDGLACVSCFVPNYFDFVQRRCLACAGGYYHNGVSCVATNCSRTYTFDVFHLRCVCPWYTPKELNGVCVPCSQGQVYNNVTKQCQICPPGTRITPDSTFCLCSSIYQIFTFATNQCQCPYNTPILTQTGKCVKCPGFYDASSRRCLQCPIGSNMVKNATTGVCQCGQQMPILVNGICRGCDNNTEYYDATTSKCIACPVGMIVLRNNNTCACPNGQVYTDRACRCPLDKPYLTATGCIACVYPRFFDQAAKSCFQCPAGYQYQALVKQCVRVQCGLDKIFNSTSQSCVCLNKTQKYILKDKSCSFCPEGQFQQSGTCKTCTNGRVYNASLKKCVCNQTINFYWNGQTCIQCQHPKYWDFGQMKCKNCPDQQIYDIFKRQCSYCPTINPYFNGQYCTICPNNLFYNFTVHKCQQCTGGKVYDSNRMVCACPTDHPFQTPFGCISCYLPNYFSIETQSCLSCPKNFIFTPSAGRCLQCPPNTPIFNQTQCVQCPANTFFNKQKSQCQRCSANRNYNKATGQCECPAESPFFNGTNCITCYLPLYFDLSDSKCKSCPNNQIYDPINFRCAYCPAQRPFLNGTHCSECPANTFYDFGKFSCVECGGGRIYNKVSQACQCSNDLIWNGARCIQCHHPKYFDTALGICKNCDGKNQIYDIVLKACTPCPIQRPKFDGDRCVPCAAPSFWNATLRDCANCSGGRVYNYQRADCVCTNPSSFFNGTKCIECYHPNYFNFETLKCMKCPNNQIYDIDFKKCVDCPLDRPVFDGLKCISCGTGKFWNITQRRCVSCSGGRVYNQSVQICQCPSNLFWNGENCIQCFIPKYFDSSIKKCVNCLPGLIYDINLRMCVSCPPQKPYNDGTKCTTCVSPTYFDPTTKNCVSCTFGRVYNSISLQCECPLSQYFTGYSCVDCYHPRYFDFDKRQCLSCPTNQVYSLEMKRCIDCPSYAPIFNGQQCAPCPDKQYYDANYKSCRFCPGGQIPNQAGVCGCPPNTFSTGSSCIECYHPKYFDFGSKQCLSCQINQVYSLQQQRCIDCPSATPIFNGQSCVACPTNQVYSQQYKTCQNCPGGQSPNPSSNTCQCPSGKFWTGYQCIQCFHPQYFDLDQKRCMNCPPNQIYNIMERKCDYCPVAVPYFDGVNCLACPQGSHFDNSTRKCIACSNGTVYNANTAKCQCAGGSFWDGTKCLTCYLPQYFDLEEKVCKNCPDGQFFDRTKRFCVPFSTINATTNATNA